MSASPSGMSNGQTPTPNGGPPQFVRKSRAADPLRARKKPVRRPNVPPKAPLKPAHATAAKPNGPPPVTRYSQPIVVNGHGLTSAQYKGPSSSIPRAKAYDGWTHPPEGQYQDFPLFTTKRALREGLRYHIARFAGKRDVDPSDQDEFVRPVVLHRRDPNQPAGRASNKDEEMKDELPIDSKERERQEILKAEKEKKRAEDLAQIAPSSNNASSSKKVQSFRNEKTTQVHRLDKTEEEKKASDLRYEEALPWHLEDADNKNIWVGTYEAALSDTNVVLVADGGKYYMIPVEKWYKFQAKGQFKAFTIEEAEAKMGKKVRESRWVMKENEMKEKEKLTQYVRKGLAGLYTVKGESATAKAAGKREKMDMDDLDFDADDLFQDDDEQVTFDPDNDEDTRDAKDKIKREQLTANIFDQANELELDEELEKEEEEKTLSKELGKGLKKALKKRELNLAYESDDSDRDPYASESEDDTSDEEKQAEIDRKRDEEAKKKLESKLPSGATSKGSNTPSGRPKHPEPLANPKSLKRPGSPNLSESSGNESTLTGNKHKKKYRHSHHPTGTSTPISGSRPASPGPMAHGQSTRPGGTMSDGEATGGDTSDGNKSTKPRFRMKNTPSGSRSGSPAPARAGSVDNRSPVSQTSTSPSGPYPQGEGSIQPQELLAACPKGGIPAADLMKLFSRRVGAGPGKTPKDQFVKMVKQYLTYGSNKLLRPK